MIYACKDTHYFLTRTKKRLKFINRWEIIAFSIVPQIAVADAAVAIAVAVSIFGAGIEAAAGAAVVEGGVALQAMGMLVLISRHVCHHVILLGNYFSSREAANLAFSACTWGFA